MSNLSNKEARMLGNSVGYSSSVRSGFSLEATNCDVGLCIGGKGAVPGVYLPLAPPIIHRPGCRLGASQVGK